MPRCCNMAAAVEHVRRNVARALERGYRHIKLHERTAEAVAAAREVAGPGHPDHGRHQLRLDAGRRRRRRSRRWRRRSRSGSRSRSGRRRISSRSPRSGAATGVPLAMGENATGVLDFRKMVAAGATDYVQPSVVKIGGLTNLWRIATQGREGRRHLRAACVLLRAGLSRDPARDRRQGARRRRSSGCSPTSASRPMRKTVPVVERRVDVPDGRAWAPIRRRK